MPNLTFGVNADIRGLKSALADARREVSRGIGSLPGAGLLTGAGLVAGATKAVSDYVERAKDIAKLAQLANTSIAEASKLLATAQAFGVSGDKISDSIRNVSQAASGSPELFKQIGISLEDAGGKARTGAELFDDVRNAIANGQGDFRTTAAAAKILGRSVEDLYPFLRASEQQVQKTTESLQAMGVVMSEEDVNAALTFAGSLKVAEMQGDALSRQLAGVLIPILGGVAEAAMVAGDMLGALISTGSGSGWDNLWANLRDFGLANNIGRGPVDANGVENVAANKAAAIDRLRVINDQVNAKAKIRADFARLSQLGLTGPGGNSSIEFPGLSGGRGRDTVMDALRDRIDAIKEEADERERAMRRALDAFEEERKAAIETIEAEQDARQEQHDLELRAIEDESRAREDAFDAIDRGRSDEIDALREQIRGTQELTDLERTRADIAAAEGDAEAERKVEIFRSAGQSANDYGRAVRDQQRRIADADKRVAEAKKKLEEDTAKVAIEARIRAIEEERQGARRALDDYKRGAEERQLAIKDQIDAEQRQSETKIAAIEKQIEAERKRATDEITALEDLTRTTLEELDDQVKAHERSAAAVGAAWDYATRPRTIDISVTGSGASVAAAALIAGIHGPGGARDPFAGDHDFPHAMTFNEPATIIGRSGTNYGTIARTGDEDVYFGGVGGSRRGSGGDSINVNAYGIGIAEAARLIARENERMLARRAARGYGRRK